MVNYKDYVGLRLFLICWPAYVLLLMFLPISWLLNTE